jgi:ectoine hydroxylase-related dioxygenase (phytanoyl-CoA dioxygenase family)
MAKQEIPAVNATTPPDEIYAVLQEHGAVRILNLVDDATMERIEAELAPRLATSRPFKPGEPNAEFLGLQTRRISGVIAHSRTSHELATHPLILALAERGLEQFQLQASQAICLMPGQGAQPLHRDDLIYPDLKHPLEKELVVNVLWAVRDFTEEVGGTRAVPGSHKWNETREPRDEESVGTVMPRGSALVFFASVWHGGGANRTQDKMRYALAMAYSRNWLRQEENQFLVAPPALARTFSPEMQKLIGYHARDHVLGVFDQKDPIQALQAGELG